MNAKRSLCDSEAGASQKHRKTVTLETKLEVLKRLDGGQRSADVGRALGLPPTTVRTIRSNAEKIRKCAESVTPLEITKVTRARSNVMVTMERLLCIWIEDMYRRNSPCSLMAIQAKALSLFEDLKKKEGSKAETETFTASRGWFDRFKKRKKLRNVRLVGESASADREAAVAYPASLKKIIDEGGYLPQQVFNADETSFFWKRMPQRTYIAQQERSESGFKPAKDRMTVLLCGNASGDLKMKPLTVYHCETPRAMKGYCKPRLPVIWRSNKKGWITRSLFREWFTSYFCPAVKEYCQAKNIESKALLVLDNAPGHPPDLDELCDGVRVTFLPSNTSCLIQPMDQGVIATFKAFYLRRTFQQALDFIGNSPNRTVKEFWHGYNVMNAVVNLSAAWDEVQGSTLNAAWRKLYLGVATESSGPTESIQHLHQEIAGIARPSNGLGEINEEDIAELLESHDEELSNSDLLEIERQLTEDQEAPELRNPEQAKTLSTKDLSEAFRLLENAMTIFTEKDPQQERSAQVNKVITDAYSCYREIYERRKRHAQQLTLDRFLQHR